MLVFSKAKLVFLSVPKTGTTALEAALAPHAAIAVLDPPELKHAPVYRYNRFFRPMVEKFIGAEVEVMALIREPKSWLGSWYRYRQRSFLDGQPQSTSGLTFEAFVQGYLAEPRSGFANIGSQAKFLEARPNGTEVNRLFRYEQLDQAVAYLQSRLGIEFTLPRSNVSPGADLTLAPETEARLHALCARDYAIWNSLG